jgi:hypothetical protein
MYYWIFMFLRNILEEFCLFNIGAIIVSKLLPFKKVLFPSLVLTIIIMLLRIIPIKFGIHTLISITFMIIFYYNFFSFSINQAAIAAFSSFIILVITEWINLNFFINKFYGLPIGEVGKTFNTPEMFITVLPPLIILIVLTASGRFLLQKNLKRKSGFKV